MVPVVLVINGYPESGKSSFCREVFVTNSFGAEISMVDLVKKVARKAGWNGEKTPKDRKFLSDLKDLLDTWDDAPFKDVSERIESLVEIVLEDYCDNVFDRKIYPIFVNARSPKDIQRFVDEFSARTIFVERTQLTATSENYISNHADTNVENYEYDYVIHNDGTYEHLQNLAKEFLTHLEEEFRNVNGN